MQPTDQTPDTPSDELTRRQLLIRGAGLVGTAGAVSLLGPAGIARPTTRLTGAALPPPAQSGIEHVVVLMMENRSFDHFLGWLPHAEGHQAGLQFADPDGNLHPTAHLTEFQGCGHPDPDHSYTGGRIQYNDGACNGWLLGSNDDYSIGYYTADDLPFYGHAAPYWTVCDHYFAAIMAPTFPNRFYMHSAQTDRLENDLFVSTVPTIWDRLAEAKLSHRYYYSDLPITALWGDKYLKFSHPVDDFFSDAANGTLPKVSFVDPLFIGEDQGITNDDHPHADIRAGQDFLNQVYAAITTSPNWKNTVFVINYDEWGGFFDHVPPGNARDLNPFCRLRGFRVPSFVISPFSRRHHVAHHTYDHTSVLKMIEWRWGLEPLTLRDTHARNLAEVLDFTSPNLHAPKWHVPPAVGVACPTIDPAELADWTGLRDQAVRTGWHLA